MRMNKSFFTWIIVSALTWGYMVWLTIKGVACDSYYIGWLTFTGGVIGIGKFMDYKNGTGGSVGG